MDLRPVHDGAGPGVLLPDPVQGNGRLLENSANAATEERRSRYGTYTGTASTDEVSVRGAGSWRS